MTPFENCRRRVPTVECAEFGDRICAACHYGCECQWEPEEEERPNP